MFEIRKHVSLSKIRKHVSLSRFPTILFYEFSGPSKKGFKNSKKEPIKSDQDFLID